jgi:hypothetical protein
MSKSKETPFTLYVKRVNINTGARITLDNEVRAVVTSILSVKTIRGMIQITGICRELN